MFLGGQNYGEESVFQRIAPENIGKGGADDRPEAIRGQCPWRVFAGGSAAEIISGQKYGGTRIPGVIEGEALPGRSIGIVAPIGESIPAKTKLVRRFEESGRNNLIGVN